MFVKYTYIEEAHKASLSSVIAQHSVVTEPLLAKLYQTAQALFQKGAAPEAGVLTQYIKGETGIVAGATDDRTGIYVQLSGPPERPPLLTVGQKWAMQATAQGLGHTATRHW